MLVTTICDRSSGLCSRRASHVVSMTRSACAIDILYTSDSAPRLSSVLKTRLEPLWPRRTHASRHTFFPYHQSIVTERRTEIITTYQELIKSTEMSQQLDSGQGQDEGGPLASRVSLVRVAHGTGQTKHISAQIVSTNSSVYLLLCLFWLSSF